MSSSSDDAHRVQEIRARLQDRWYSAEKTREDVRYLLARIAALAVERDAALARAEDAEARSTALVEGGNAVFGVIDFEDYQSVFEAQTLWRAALAGSREQATTEGV